jgi:hypothetical protein
MNASSPTLRRHTRHGRPGGDEAIEPGEQHEKTIIYMFLWIREAVNVSHHRREIPSESQIRIFRSATKAEEGQPARLSILHAALHCRGRSTLLCVNVPNDSVALLAVFVSDVGERQFLGRSTLEVGINIS